MFEHVLVNGDYDSIHPTDESCEGLKRASSIWGGCAPCLYRSGEIIYISGCDDSTNEPVKFCPYCGREFLVEVR